MPPPPAPRAGIPLEIRGHRLPFSFWPVTRTTRRFGLQSTLFATNPWAVITQSVKSRCPAPARPAALAFLSQATDFYAAATSAGVVAAKPLLLYYCFMNVSKAYILTQGLRPNLDTVQHGLSEQMGAGGQQLLDAFLRAFPSNPPHLNLFDDFLKVIRGTALPGPVDYQLIRLMPQIVFGHGLWANAADVQERFVGLEDVAFFHDDAAKSIWLRIYVFAHTLTRLGVSHQQFLDDTDLAAEWREVDCDDTVQGHRLLCFEQRNVVTYTGRPADAIMSLVNPLRSNLWSIVRTTKPYRHYYTYMAPAAERPFVLPQLASIYALAYYLGSITRYRPHHFATIMNGDYEAFIDGFVNDQSGQFLYLLASEFAQQELLKAATV
jgi:hypothetical protein